MHDHPIPYIGKNLLFFGKWCEENGTFVGAIALAVLSVAGVNIYKFRERFSWAFKVVWFWPAMVIPSLALSFMLLNKYLTFMSAAATTIGVLVALDNNRKSHAREEKRFARQAMAARTAFSHELSALCDWCEDIARTIYTTSEYPLDEQVRTFQHTTFPNPPPTAAATLKEMIISTNNEDIAERCGEAQRYIQLIKANLRLLKDWNGVTEYHLESHMLRVMILYSLCQSMFGYAREGEQDIEPLDWDQVDTYTIFMNIHGYESYYLYTDRVKARYRNPLDFNKPGMDILNR